MLAAMLPLSEHGAPLTPLLDRGRTEHGPDGLVEYRLEAALGEGGALQVLHGSWVDDSTEPQSVWSNARTED